MVIHNKYNPICPTGDTLKPQSDLKHRMNLYSHIVSETETFDSQVILSGKGIFMKQQSYTYLNKMREEIDTSFQKLF